MNGIPTSIRTKLHSNCSSEVLTIPQGRMLERNIDQKAEEIARLKCRIKMLEDVIDRKDRRINELEQRPVFELSESGTT